MYFINYYSYNYAFIKIFNNNWFNKFYKNKNVFNLSVYTFFLYNTFYFYKHPTPFIKNIFLQSLHAFKKKRKNKHKPKKIRIRKKLLLRFFRYRRRFRRRPKNFKRFRIHIKLFKLKLKKRRRFNFWNYYYFNQPLFDSRFLFFYNFYYKFKFFKELKFKKILKKKFVKTSFNPFFKKKHFYTDLFKLKNLSINKHSLINTSYLNSEFFLLKRFHFKFKKLNFRKFKFNTLFKNFIKLKKINLFYKRKSKFFFKKRFNRFHHVRSLIFNKTLQKKLYKTLKDFPNFFKYYYIYNLTNSFFCHKLFFVNFCYKHSFLNKNSIKLRLKLRKSKKKRIKKIKTIAYKSNYMINLRRSNFVKLNYKKSLYQSFLSKFLFFFKFSHNIYFNSSVTINSVYSRIKYNFFLKKIKKKLFFLNLIKLNRTFDNEVINPQYNNYSPIYNLPKIFIRKFKKLFKKKHYKKYKKYLQYYLISSLELLFKKKFFFKRLNSNFFKNPKFSKQFKIRKLKKIFWRIKKLSISRRNKFNLREILEIIFYSFYFKDISLLKSWFLRNYYKLYYKRQKSFLNLFHVLLKNAFYSYKDIFALKGFYFFMKGKINVSSNAKKKRFNFKIESSNKSTKYQKIDFQQGVIKVKSGSSGLLMILSYT